MELISIAVFSRRDELAQVLTELVFRKASDSYLLDYNFNIETVMSSDSFLKVNESLMVLELFVSAENQGHRRIVLELNIDETRAFVD